MDVSKEIRSGQVLQKTAFGRFGQDRSVNLRDIPRLFERRQICERTLEQFGETKRTHNRIGETMILNDYETKVKPIRRSG